MNSTDRQRGFTLVELLVVIIIIGILAAIAIPAFLNQRQKGFDATLKADLKNAETAFETYMAGGGTFEDIRALTGATNVMEIRGKNAAASSSQQWNAYPELGFAPVSDDSRLSVVSYKAASGRWLPHQEGDYCITGVNGKSKYDYPGGNVSRYDEILYIDRQAGGLRTMSELVERRSSGKMVSCKGYVDGYMAATGAPIPAG